MNLRPASLVLAIAFALALLAAVAAADLPELLTFHTIRGRAGALVVLALLLATIALGSRAALRDPAMQRLWTSFRHRRRLALGVAIWLFAAAHPLPLTSDPSLTELYRLAVSLAAPLAGLVLTVVAASRLVKLIPEGPRSLPPVPVAALFAIAAATIIATVILARAPHIPDEIAYLFDARTFAAGERVSAPPAIPASFPPPEWIEVEEDRAYGVFPPGWPLVLSLGVLARVPWLTNALIGALAVLVVSSLAFRTSPDPRTARRRAAWLLALSPFALFLSASYMAHPAAVLWTLLAFASYLAMSERASPGRAIGLALAGALLLATRPIEALAVLTAIGADLLPWRRPAPRSVLALLALAIGLAASAAFILADNARLTGSPIIPPVNRYFDDHYGPGTNRLGFGPDIGLTWDRTPAGHTPVEAIWNLSLNLEHLNRHLLGWPSGSLLLVVVYLLAARKTRGERLLLVHGAAILIIYALYWYHGVAFGPRFLASLIPALVLFTWRGATEVASWLARERPGQNWDRWVNLGIAFSVACAIALYLPIKSRAEYRDLRGIDGTLVRQAESVPTPALLFVEGPEWPDYGALYFLNAPDFRGPRVVALSRGPEADAEVRVAYPGREVRILRRDGAIHRVAGGGGGPDDPPGPR